jgi:hypothetical protein
MRSVESAVETYSTTQSDREKSNRGVNIQEEYLTPKR